MTAHTRVRPLLVALLALLAGTALLIAAYAIPGLLLLAIFSRFLLMPIAVGGVILLVVHLARSYWPAAILSLFGVVGLYLLVSYPRPYDSVVARSARWLQFAYYRSELDARAARITTSRGSGTPSVLAVDGFVATGSNGFVFDSSGEARLPQGSQSARWKSLVAETELGTECGWTTEHLYGPYYSYSSSC